MQPRKLIAATSATMIIAFVVALMPFYLHFDFDAKRPRDLLVPDIRKMEAHATPAAVSGAMGFIDTMAGYAGLTTSEFIASCVGMITAGTGYDITKGAGVSMADSASACLEGLIDAADYPTYDELTTEEQELWGTADNYHAAKFNSLMDAFGLGDMRDDYYGSGGGNIDPGQNALDTLATIGDIGNRWKNGIGVKFGEIIGAISGADAVATWIGYDSTEGLQIDFTGNSGKPSEWPDNVNYAYANMYFNSAGTVDKIVATDREVYFIIAVRKNGISVCLTFSDQPFNYGSSSSTNMPNIDIAATWNSGVGGQGFYWGRPLNIGGNALLGTIAPNYVSSYDPEYSFRWIAVQILYGDHGTTAPEPEKIEGYPEQEIPQDQPVYFPTGGITPGMSYQEFNIITRPTNIYNPDNETGGDEWKQETSQNVLPLMNIEFDKLFPFCMLFDIQRLFDKVTSVTGTAGAQESYMTISIPLDVPGFGEGETLDLNLQWLYDLLVTVRPFVQILLGAGLLFVTIRFWQGVLTG